MKKSATWSFDGKSSDLGALTSVAGIVPNGEMEVQHVIQIFKKSTVQH